MVIPCYEKITISVYELDERRPERKYRFIHEKYCVLENEAEQIALGELRAPSIAYRLLNRRIYPGDTYLSFMVIRNTKKLRKIASLL